ncbi:rhodanese-like domain-containing protein [Mycobacterium sp. E740]|uniref:rhodanese-like domain-containing protein n=1 Tax=Mycobacterium sp. E740 TaxID=1834149 RepID=UPI001E2ED989|nr:rhodanese-like domain-containing protein [Mycobacterium sp. E740]
MKIACATPLSGQSDNRVVVSPGRLKRPLFWIAALFGALVMTACISAVDPDRQISPQTASVRLVEPNEFTDAILEPTRVTINVHVPFEGDIAGTDLSVPFDQLAAQSDRLPTDRRTGLAVYCRSGPMSAIAVNVLRDLGYLDVVELRGGMRAWQAEGRQLTGI